jgi:hypothetical protein
MAARPPPGPTEIPSVETSATFRVDARAARRQRWRVRWLLRTPSAILPPACRPRLSQGRLPSPATCRGRVPSFSGRLPSGNDAFTACVGMLAQATAMRGSASAILRDTISPTTAATYSTDSEGPSRTRMRPPATAVVDDKLPASLMASSAGISNASCTDRTSRRAMALCTSARAVPHGTATSTRGQPCAPMP